MHCQDASHKEDLDQYTLAVLDTIQDAAEVNLSTLAPKNSSLKKIVPGWIDEVKLFRDKAFFWHQIWKSCGRPINNEIHKIMKHTRNIYHYQFKKCKNAEQRIKKDKLLNACLGDGGDLFKEIKTLRKSEISVATSIDGISQNIPEHFSTIYSQLYNSADDTAKLAQVYVRANDEVSATSLDILARITPDLVNTACKRLKPGKSDPIHSFSSD